MSETIATAKVLAEHYMACDIPVFTEGKPGVGKSEMWEQIANEQNIGFKDIRLAQMDPVDLRGLPVTQNGLTTWTRPDFWPIEKQDGPKGIILFDELADCGKAMQSAAYQIILNGRAGPHVIPKGWYRVGAGNRREDRAAAQSMSTALASRFAWISITEDEECFRAYANLKGFHETIVGFIRFRPSMLHSMEGADTKAFPCPRQWERVSRIMTRLESLSDAAAKEVRARLVSGLVGQGAATEFEGYLRTLQLPSLEDVINNPKGCFIPKEPSSRYALSAMLSRYADDRNFGKIMTYCKRDDFGRDFEICVVLDATKRDATLCETHAFTEFANRNKGLHL